MKDAASMTTKRSQSKFQSQPNPMGLPLETLPARVLLNLTGAAGNLNVQATVLKFLKPWSYLPER